MDIVVFSNKKMDENKVDKSTVPASASSISPPPEVPLRVGSLNLSDGSSTSRLTTGNLSSNPLDVTRRCGLNRIQMLEGGRMH